ncbi:MAG: NAD(P)/FAD-dependent oxidoreductase [Woeseiaceae bacterium]|nr:NAD(P)/FAD-dependent oxidoreductase [Woeseiaceae bacterium]
MTEQFDAIVVGGGHNGLICATLLAQAGKDVLLLEANETVGGAAVTETFADDFRVSRCAHLLYGLQPDVARDLGISPRLASDNMATIALDTAGKHVRIDGARAGGVDSADQAELREFHAQMLKFSGLLRTLLNKTPPRLGSNRRQDLVALAQLGLRLRLLGKADMREFLRLIGMNIYDEVEERFGNPLLRGALSLDAVLGTHLGPRSPNTILTLLYRWSATGGRISSPAGGMGAISDALADGARRHGVDIRTRMKVKRIVVDNGRAAGVETEDGTTFDSLTVVSNADPKHTVMDLVGTRHVETGFARRIHNVRMQGNAAKLHLALDGLPTIKGLDKKDLSQRLVVAPDADYVERAFNPAKYGEYSPQPVIELTFPSLRDDSLAPAGKHVMSAIVQYAPHALRSGWSDETRAGFERVIMDKLAEYSPDLGKRVTDSELLAPVDIAQRFGMGGGHWHHGELTLDQFLFVRPVAGAAQYALPLEGLFLCGAGAHPGGDVSGAAGRNAARAILAREKSA